MAQDIPQQDQARDKATILAALRTEFARFYRLSPEEVDPHTTFFAMGADSLSLLQASQAIEDRFGVEVPFRRLMEELTTLDAVAEHVATTLAERSPAAEDPATDAGNEPTTGTEGSDDAHRDRPPREARKASDTRTEAPTRATTSGRDVPARRPERPARPPASAPSGAGSDRDAGTLERIFARQLQLMERQLEALGAGGRSREALRDLGAAAVEAPTASAPASGPAPEERPRKDRAGDSPRASAARAATEGERGPDGLDERQRRHLEELVADLARRTAGSKERTQRWRRAHADSRTTSNFRRLWKEAAYQIMAERAEDGRIWDVDGREYVDITMGFGSLLFGHTPPFLLEALEREVPRGLRLGPQTLAAGEVAEAIRRLTGVERVAFTNSGTEAVMSALRLARAVTGRERIALFPASYHGSFDGVLGRPGPAGDGSALPMAPGVPRSSTDDLLFLDFGEPSTFERLDTHRDELAAILMEPIASRRPELDPEFVARLRAWCDDADVALVFDEVITGFRCHPGGAQALFDVQADLVTYGKAVGAGLPIGVVSGKARFMDPIDGGPWSFGDDSYPPAQSTLFRGTFFKHPYVLAVARGALAELENRGRELQDTLTRRTDALCARLDRVFEAADVPLRARNFTSLFLFVFPPELQGVDQEVFYFHLLQKGVYVWEGRTCYLSTAHTDEDLDRVVEAVEETVAAMTAAGFLDAPEATPAPPKQSGPPVALRDRRRAAQTPSTDDARTPTAEPRELPATPLQRDLWTEAHLAPEASRAYHETMALYLHGPLDRPALVTALEGLVERHDALRSAFGPDGETLVVEPSVELPVPFEDLARADDPELAFAEWLGGGEEPFDLERAPLLRASLARLGTDDHVLLLTLHHLVTDGWSNGVLLRDLAALYRRATGAETDELPAPERLDDALSRRRDTPTVEQYWLERFSHRAPVLDLPTDRARPAEEVYDGAEESVTLAPELVDTLRAVAQERGASLFALLFAAYGVLLHRLAGQDDLVVGTAAAGQPDLGARDLVGYFVSLLPIRSRHRDDESFVDCLERVRRDLLDGFEHQGYPLGRLVDRLGLARDASRPALVATSFNLDRPIPDLGLPGLEAEAVRIPTGRAKFELAVDGTEGPDGLRLEWEYRTALFDAATVRRWADAFATLLAGVAEDPSRPVADLPLLGPEEERAIVAGWNDTATDYPRDATLAQLFEETAEAHGERTALAFADAELTYDELAARSARLARLLRARGLERGDRVAVLLERSAAAVVAMVATVRAGGAYVPLDLESPPERLALMIEDASPRLFVTDEARAERLPEAVRETAAAEERLIRLDTDASAFARRRPHLPDWPLDARDLAYVIFTSGSTGRPKGVAVPHRGVVRLVRRCRYVDIAPGERIPQLANLSFDAATFEIWGSLLSGAALVGIGRDDALDPERLATRLAEEEIDHAFLTTALFQQVLRQRPDAFAGIGDLLVGGQWMEPEVARRALEPDAAPGRLVHVYGPTESTTFATWGPIESVGAHDVSVPIGRPVANTRAHVVDRRLRPVPPGVAGEIVLAGDGLARGYLGRPRASAERFVPDPFAGHHGGEPGDRLYRTGDLGRHLADGRIDFLGRTDDQVKIRGVRVEPGEVQSALARHPRVSECFVQALTDEAGTARLVAWVVTEGDGNLGVSEVHRFLADHLPPALLPADVVTLERLPLGPTGKVDAAALPIPDAERPDLDVPYVAPSTPAERHLARIWADVLGRDRVGVDDNFFELGGDSILAIQIISAAEEAGLALRPKQIFQHPTIAELAERGAPADGSPIDATDAIDSPGDPAVGPFPPTPVQRWFWDRDPVDPHHFNQAMLYELGRRLETRDLERALAALVAHHGALRLRVAGLDSSGGRRDHPPEHRIEAADTATGVDLTVHDLGDVEPDDHPAAIEQIATRRQGDLDLAEGPILAATLLRRGGDRPDRLLLVAHHLAVDFFSWRILQRDLESAFDQVQNDDGPIELPPIGTPWRTWASRLADHAAAGGPADELPFWRRQLDGPVAAVPLDHPDGTNRVGDVDTVIHSLELDASRALVTEVPRRLEAQIHEALLTALGSVLGEWAGGPVLVDLEGHGREDLFDGVQLARTVGWFTSIYPLRLAVEPLDAETAGRRVESTRDLLRRVPRGGVGWGVLRHGHDSPHTDELASKATPEIVFNYLGRLGGARPGAVLSPPLPDPVGPLRSEDAERPHRLEVNALVSDDERLHVYWSFSRAQLDRDTVEALSEGFLDALRTLVEHCRGAPASARSPEAEASSDPETDREAAREVARTVDTEVDTELIDVEAEEMDGLLAELELADE